MFIAMLDMIKIVRYYESSFGYSMNIGYNVCCLAMLDTFEYMIKIVRYIMSQGLATL